MPRRPQRSRPHAQTRRELLGLAGGAALGALFGWRLPPGTPLVWAGPRPAGGDSFVELAGAHPTPELTPVDRLYVQSWNGTPGVAANDWSLEVGGLVERPLALGVADLGRLPAFTQPFTLICIGNTVSGEQIGTIEWTGVRLRDLLERAGVRPGAVDLRLEAADRYTESIPIGKALEPTTMLAYRMNGAPLTADHGFPARLIVPGIYGMKNVKWVTRMEVVDHDYKGYWEERGWDDAAIIRTTSRVDAPAFFQRIARSPVVVAGVAYAGDRGIALVEVSTDAGSTWQPAALKLPLGPFTWSLWAYRWRPARAGEHVLAARATDGRGGAQGTKRERPFPAGAGGLHEVIVEVLPAALT